jgi:hypothetical protein
VRLTVERPNIRLVWDRSKAGTSQGDETARVEPGKDVEKRDAAPVTNDELAKDQAPKQRVVWNAPGEPPAFGGLHQLALAGIGVPKTSELLAEADFSTYRAGMNNRALWRPIAEDLNALFGVHISYGYSHALEAFPQLTEPPKGRIGMTPDVMRRFSIGERALDKLLVHFDRPEEQKAVATFAIAHEFFHTLMRHADLINWGTERPRGFWVKDHKRYERLFELQADYLATKYLLLRGLPAEPVIEMFGIEGEFKEAPNYPPGEERANNVRRALEPGFDLALFQNEIVDCLAFLDFIAIKPQ